MSENAENQTTETETQTEGGQETHPVETGSDTGGQAKAEGGQTGNANPQPSQHMVPTWRLNEETQKRRDLEARLAALERERQPKQPQDEGEPKPDGYPSYEAYDAARIQYHATRAAKAQFESWKQSQSQEAQQRQWAERVQSADARFEQEMTKAYQADPVLYQKLQATPLLHPALGLALKESEAPADLVRHFVDNPQEVIRLNAMPVDKAIREMGRMEGKLAGAKGQPPNKVSKMPGPIPPVGTGKATGGDGEMNLSKALSLLYPS